MRLPVNVCRHFIENGDEICLLKLPLLTVAPALILIQRNGLQSDSSESIRSGQVKK